MCESPADPSLNTYLGETIFLKGDESDQFYIIKGGKCSVITENDPGADIVLHQGDCFG